MAASSPFRRYRLGVLLACLGFLAPAMIAPAATAADELVVDGYDIDPDAFCALRELWTEQLLATYPAASWAPMRVELTDEMLALMGLPSREWLLSHRFPVPTMVSRDGAAEEIQLPPVDGSDVNVVPGPALASYAGTGCFGIRPGAFLLLINDGSIGWCSMAHVYGNAGAYSVSTAGHCGKTGDIATVIAAVGNRNGATQPVLLDFGKFSKSTGDGGVGNDWALISVTSAYQHLVSPTMCLWGGPLGMYAKSGSTVAVTIPRRGFVPDVTFNPDPTLLQTIVHYGHGTGIGTGGTPRVAEALHWDPDHFMFWGAISPGDSGSGSNALGGDTLGSVNEAAGINTHIYVDALMRDGLGIMAGTRAIKVSATLANGQILAYPVPLAGAP